jgi:hypothetical protein
MNRLFSILDRFFVGPPGKRTRAPVIHPIDAMRDFVWLHDCGLADEQIDVPAEWS